MLGFLAVLAGASSAAQSTPVEFFERRIRPVLAEHCYSCHSARAEKLKADLRVDGRNHLLGGGESGAAVIPGEPERGHLVRAIAYEDPDLQMPPKTRLPPEVIEDFRKWIRDGAVWPETKEPDPSDKPAPGKTGGFDVAERRARHWAWRSVQEAEVPSVSDVGWSERALDRFVLARLEEARLRPAPRAARHTLVRRASLLLTGLPPAMDEVERFERDSRPDRDAFGAMLDRLLASPHFGEHWARHWLDKIRYAETMGHEFDYPILGAWRYRDYVVRAFNQDLPWDAFAREQIAGDLLAEPRRNPTDGSLESRVATAQFWLCQQVHSPVDVRAQQSETIDNQIDVVSKAFLGLTVSCARCHDHKFDAISTRDYYALHGILGSSRHAYRAVDDSAPRLATAQTLRERRRTLPTVLAARLLRFIESHPESRIQPTSNVGPLELRPEETRLADDGWFADGEAFLPDAGLAGLPAAPDAKGLRLVLPGWKHGAALARRFQGFLRTPTVTLDKQYVHLRVAGTGSRVSVAVEGFPLLRSPIYGTLRQTVRNPEPHWITIDVSMWKGRRAWLDFSDISEADPASDLPPESRAVDGWIAVGDVVLSSSKEPPRSVAHAAVADARAVLDRWAKDAGSLTPAEAAWLDALMVAARAETSDHRLEEWRRIDAAIEPPALATTMADGTGIDEPVFVRGNHRTPGPIVARRFLEALSDRETGDSSSSQGFREGSGRLALANAVTEKDNPLFDRVVVNWVWAHLFGRGLVASVDNFGVLGEAPSHPALLDWLAWGFRENGRSIKSLIRMLVSSETWQMSSRIADPAAEAQDPDNLLYHRANFHRLEGESIRDSLLAVSGRLDRSVGGASVPIHLTAFMEGRGRPGQSGPVDGHGRRSLYLEVRRNFLSPFMLAFDQPVPATTVGRRSVSNVPAQSLALMNDPFIGTEARHWAERVLREVPGTVGERIGRLYAQAFARRPTPGEVSDAARFLDEALIQHGANPTDAWAGLCHALVNSKEFIFVE